jgi:thiol peroxidase
MTTITLKGQPIHTVGKLPITGDIAPDFTLTRDDFTEIMIDNFPGKKIIMSIFPSIDTSVCSQSTRQFNEYANKLDNIVILCVSADLPFALNRFCAAEGLKNIVMASTYRHPEFGTNYGVTIVDGPLAGLLSRAVVVVNPSHVVLYSEQVPEIAQEPHYEALLSALEK